MIPPGYSLRDWACLRKRRYLTEEAAWGVAKELPEEAQVYPCEFNEGEQHWHICRARNYQALLKASRFITPVPNPW